MHLHPSKSELMIKKFTKVKANVENPRDKRQIYTWYKCYEQVGVFSIS